MDFANFAGIEFVQAIEAERGSTTGNRRNGCFYGRISAERPTGAVALSRPRRRPSLTARHAGQPNLSPRAATREGAD